VGDASAINGGGKELASVIVASRDRPEALDRCLRAIVSNTVVPAEIIVVDNGSSGIAAPLRTSVEERTALVHLKTPPNGVSRARNYGIANASHDLIAFTDDDCVPDRNWLAALLVACSADGIDGATGRVLPLASTDRSHVAVSSRTERTPARYVGRQASRSPWQAGTGGNLLLPRVFLQPVGGFAARFGPGAPFRAAEDVELLYRVLRCGFTMAYEPESVVFHETRSRRQRLATRYPYGYGMGAFIGGPAREASDSLSLASGYFSMQFRKVALSVRSRSGLGLLEPVLTTAGFLAGVAAWRRKERESGAGR
jgi:glycosyltransferase involved in cell wall biosynthesis